MSAAAKKPLRGLTVLVVDDAPTIVKMVTRMLTAAGAVVDFAKDGREGVEMFKAAEVAFDMVVTDIQVREGNASATNNTPCRHRCHCCADLYSLL